MVDQWQREEGEVKLTNTNKTKNEKYNGKRARDLPEMANGVLSSSNRGRQRPKVLWRRWSTNGKGKSEILD
ncbi:hypothetical protein Patl1_29043 [Pistacia atlantica]|uniref:Uncharacterized protein n=1 Tax=Pistacia atlantica TaxID=434234 RepID=A0ACC1BDY6_9ROSI|nr:hypothetical protein Patl1_29043 [Pistacia atlantica]